MKIKGTFILLLILLCSALQASPLTKQLKEKIRNTPAQEYIRIYIALTDNYNFSRLRRAKMDIV